MANYKLCNTDQLDADLTTVADAIRSKGGTTGKLKFPEEYKAAIDAITSKSEAKKASGTFTSKGSASGVTVSCGFKPDFVTITENRTYYDNDTNKTYNLALTFNFIDCTDNVNCSTWTDRDCLYELFVSRTDNGFTVSAWKYNSDMTDASWWGNKTFTYYAYKNT